MDADEEAHATMKKDKLAGLCEAYYQLEKKIWDEISKLPNFAVGDCDCGERETIDFIHEGEWKEIQTWCINCGGMVENDY